jgi:hypothetical protein
MMQGIGLEGFDIEKLRERLRKMTNKELREFGEAAKYMVSPRANMGKPPLPAFVLQLKEARAEWRRATFAQEVAGRDFGQAYF